MKQTLIKDIEDIMAILEKLSSELLKISDKHVYTVILINDIRVAFKQIQKEIERLS